MLLILLFLSCRATPEETSLKQRSYSTEDVDGTETPGRRRSLAANMED